MRMLVSNDDGVQAAGLAALAKGLASLGEVIVVAPDRNRSGASHSLTLDHPLYATRLENGFYSVDGTPTDCVHLAVSGLLDPKPDLVISGINAGPNLGDDVLYSGTVAAAVEGRFLGLPALAVSLAGDPPYQHYETAARVTALLVEKLKEITLPPATILNVNVPNEPWESLQGIETTRLGNRHIAENIVPGCNPRGRSFYWIGVAGPEQDAGEGTDFHAIRHHKATVTPLHIDLTRHEVLPQIAQWLHGVLW